MYSVCILEDQKEHRNDWWIDEIIKPTSEFTDKFNEQQVIGYFPNAAFNPHKVFFAISHPFYYSCENYIFILSNNLNVEVIQAISRHKIYILPTPDTGNIIAVSHEPDQFQYHVLNSKKINNYKELINCQLLIFKSFNDFNDFKKCFNEFLSSNDYLKASFLQIKDLRKKYKKLHKENKWNSSQVDILQTSLNLIRIGFQKDLMWYKNELNKVKLWYKENYEELPPGFSRIGKGINRLRRRLKFLR